MLSLWVSFLFLLACHGCGAIVVKTMATPDQDTKPKPSLIYVKTHKTGGSTFAGVVRRIGSKHGYAHVRDGYAQNDFDTGWLNATGRPKETSVWASHASRMNISAKIEARVLNPFYMTSLRDPVSRCMSAFYAFKVGLDGVDPDDTEAKLNFIEEFCFQRRLLDYIQQHDNQVPHLAVAAYDFILVTERFEESVLAFQRVLSEAGMKVPQRDLLYISAKISGEKIPNGTSIRPEHPDFRTEPTEVQDRMEILRHSGDHRIHLLANKNLDKINIPQGEVAAFQARLDLLSRRCADVAWDNCLWGDSGCGQACIDHIAASQGWD